MNLGYNGGKIDSRTNLDQGMDASFCNKDFVGLYVKRNSKITWVIIIFPSRFLF